MGLNDRAVDLPGQAPLVRCKSVCHDPLEAEHFGDRLGKGGEAARHQQGHRPAAAHRPDKRFGARVGSHPFFEALADDRIVEPLEQRDPFLSDAANRAHRHRALGDRGDLRLDPGIIGHSSRPPARSWSNPCRRRAISFTIGGGLDDHIDASITPSASGDMKLDRRGAALDVGRAALVDPAPSLAEMLASPSTSLAANMASDQPIGCYQRTMIKSLPPVALVAGPTARASRAGVALARRSNGVIVNADASQIYRDLNVLSARPSAADMVQAEHRLFGFRNGAEPCSAADYAAMARTEIAEIHASGRLPILVGGTGLYVRSLLDGIAPVPPIDLEIRQKVRAATVAENRAGLLKAIPSGGALNAGDSTRIARALEVALSTGRTLSQWQDGREGGIGDAITLRPLILSPPREWLNQRCDERFAAMLDGGAVAEVEALLARNLDPDLPVMRAIGVREIGAMLRGELTHDQALAAGQLATRRYAKRQYTWFAHQPPANWPRFGEPLEGVGIDAALALLGAAE